jgi:hypothetical protein
LVSAQRDAKAARRCFERAPRTTKIAPTEVTTDQAPAYPAVLEGLLPAAWHRTDLCANDRVESDRGRLKARLRPMRGLKQDRSARVIITGGAVAFAVTVCEQGDWRHENSSRSLRSRRSFGLRRLPLPARRHRAGRALIPALRPVVPRRTELNAAKDRQGKVRRRDLFGGLLHEYWRAA